MTLADSTFRDHWRSRLGTVTTLQRNQLRCDRRLVARHARNPRGERIRQLEEELTGLTAALRDIDMAINDERCVLVPDGTEGLHRALNRRWVIRQRIREVSRHLSDLSVQPPDSVLRSVLGRFVVTPGCVVEIRFADQTTPDRVELITEHDVRDERCSTRSPLGRALLGKRPGQVARYRTCAGTEQTATVIRIVRTA
ncbi:GreA/GreB family elongation factor [Gordonia sp. CPCC 206044]|uniref:GreA/GreB family elongation factor n=1 Tax=Gordonia sp. CPCC 206044 TaxID=3140793 RepID=UPI003AF34948